MIVRSKWENLENSQLSLLGSLSGQPPLTEEEVLAVTSAFNKKANGVVYTPPKLADYLASKVTSFLFDDLSKDLSHRKNGKSKGSQIPFRVLDPACGDGDLLVAAWNQLRAQKHRLGYHKALIADQPDSVLCGIDIDPRAIQRTRERIRRLDAQRSLARGRSFSLLTANALFPVSKRPSAEGWKSVLRKFNAETGFDIIIANPPWGADVNHYRESLGHGDFALYQGQFDTSDLFVELAVRLLKPGGYFAFIVPDSLFTHERKALRKVLLEETQIQFVARLGERIFERINRACALIICKKTTTGNPLKETQCLRLTPPVRKRILDGTMSFAEAETLLSHRVPQNRFLTNRDYLFDIDVTSAEEKTLRSFDKLPARFRDFLNNARGVELSKTGKICQCEKCRLWLPLPNGADSCCPHCKARLALSPRRIASIVSVERQVGFKPMLVGQNIRRYKIDSTCWINLHADGINYKETSTFAAPKLLVRKTGVGISAAIDYSKSYTNQVVYIFRLKDSISSRIPLEVFLAILNSRLMYYYLVKNHGETEWRSHPYITQKQIMDLPSPGIANFGNGFKEAADELVALIKPYTTRNMDLPLEVDARVERIVAALYGMNRRHYENIYETLDSVQELLPVRVLKRITIADIFSNETD
jgi:adenine-specific DNA-methyltransferase